MNILFLLRSLDMGGLEVVSSVLANKFASEGHNISIFAFEKRTGNVLSRICNSVDVIIGGKYEDSPEQVSCLREILIKKKVDIVINQWGLPLVPIKVLLKAKRSLSSIKIISVYHNDPLQNGRVQGVEVKLLHTPNPVMKLLLYAKKFAYRCVTGYAMRYVYLHSDVFEVLSPSFVSHFQQFTLLKITPKLVVQTNPITIDNTGFEYRPQKKNNEIIYVGRVDYTQKRVHRIIDVWAQLEDSFPDWELTIVGDGVERENMEHLVSYLNLHHVNFEGFQSPRPYYERASILLLTSEFEGFPLVLAECMSFGVVPVVYGSYSAVYDIIDDDKDGIIVPKGNDGFNADVMAERIKPLMANHDKLNYMALNTIEKSKNYSINKIYEQWMGVIHSII